MGEIGNGVLPKILLHINNSKVDAKTLHNGGRKDGQLMLYTALLTMVMDGRKEEQSITMYNGSDNSIVFDINCMGSIILKYTKHKNIITQTV